MTTTGHHHNSSCVSVKDFSTNSASRHRFQLISALTDTSTTLFIASCMQVGTSEVLPIATIPALALAATTFGVPFHLRSWDLSNVSRPKRRSLGKTSAMYFGGWKKEALEMKACGLAWAVVSAPDSRLVCLCCLKCCRCGCGYEPNRRSDKVSSTLP